MTPRFLFVTSGYPPTAVAGLERGGQRLAQALATRGYRVSVLTLAVNGLPTRAREQQGVEVLRVLKPLRLGGFWGLSYIAQTAAWLWRLRHQWDFVFCQQLYLHSVAAVLVARRLRKVSANLLVAADSYSDISRLAGLTGGKVWLKLALAADGQFALSRRSSAELLAAGVAPERILPYRYFVDTQLFSPDASQPRSGFLFLGRLDPQKNLSLLVDAFERVHGRYPDAKLQLVGAGPDEARVRARIAEGTAAGAITMKPWTDDAPEHYRGALALVTASDAEGLSNVLIEAMACGTPIVTTDVSGARDVLDADSSWPEPLAEGTFVRGTGGLMVNRGDATALAEALSALYVQADLRDALGIEARRRVESAYSEAASVTDFLGHVARLLGC